ncbi:hypothetical protein J6590_066507 [Homalodisca vitripennis]|nr:hypothetical protein J6590_066507 [Homalodisca vitripennis]
MNTLQNVLVAASQGGLGAGQTVLLASQGITSSALRAQPPLTVLQQGNQQILLPPGFHASALNIKALQGLKVIPITPSPAAKGVPGRQQVFARIINPSNIRPVMANLVQSDQPPTSNPPVTSE